MSRGFEAVPTLPLRPLRSSRSGRRRGLGDDDPRPVLPPRPLVHHDAGGDRHGQGVVHSIERDAHHFVGRVEQLLGHPESLAPEDEDHPRRERPTLFTFLRARSRSTAQRGLPPTAFTSPAASATRTTVSYFSMPIEPLGYKSPSPTTKTSRAR